MEGSRVKTVGPVVLTCMSEEARGLMEKALDEYARFKGVGKEALHGPAPGGPCVYLFACWLFRHSGLVGPATGSNNVDLPAD